MIAGWVGVALAGSVLLGGIAEAGVGGPSAVVEANDNRRAAGRVEGSVVTLRLRAGEGRWQPEGPEGPALTVEAFGEEQSPLTVPGPLIRVVEGTTVAVSIRNDLSAPLRVHGLCTRDGSPCAALEVAPGSNRDVRFLAGLPGTYHYWATTIGAPVPFRELAGALVVDPVDGGAPDRIFVITEWSNLTPAQLGAIFSADVPSEAFLAQRPQLTFVMNGRSWPATERLRYHAGTPVRWRIVNLSSQTHPMHLHGFYFTVRNQGDGREDRRVNGGTGRQVVTQVVPPGGTMQMEWTPDREGNWLFHCHVMHHVAPARRLQGDGASSAPGSHAHHDASLGMAGMVLGITVLPATGPGSAADAPAHTAARRLVMTLDPLAGGATGIAITEPGTTPLPAISPGPPLILRRGEPVEITIENHLPKPTSIHWHGIELDSFYDGVHGWSGQARRMAPMVEPGGRFVVRLTPPRSGTFIYHTHLHDYDQLTSGLYGAILVTGEDESFDISRDHPVLLGRSRATEASGILEDTSSFVINGEPAPRWTWQAGSVHRLRLVNITPDDVLTVELLDRDGVGRWRPVAKDGAPVPSAESAATPARARLASGETLDVEVAVPSGRATLWLEVRSASGKWQAQGRVIVK